MCMTTKFGKVMTYCDKFPCKKLHNALNMWSHEATW